MSLPMCRVKQINKKQAKALVDAEWWLYLEDIEVVKFQLVQWRMCIDHTLFMEKLTKVLGRTVAISETAFAEELMIEIEGKINPPEFEDVLNKLPEKKRILVEKV